jgi:subtilase family serine protease
MKTRSMAGVALLGVASALTVLLPMVAIADVQGKNMGPADKNEMAHFSVYLPLTHTADLEKLLQAQTDPTSSSYHQWLTPSQFKQQFGPSNADMQHVTSLLQAEGFKVVAEHTQNIEVEGTVSSVERTFSSHIQRMQLKSGAIKLAAAEKHLTLPATLAAVGAVIPEFALHVAHVHSQRAAKGIQAAPLLRLASLESLFYPNDLNEAYQLPSFRTEAPSPLSRRPVQVAGVGAHIGIVMSSVISPADLASTFNSSLNLGGGQALVQDYADNSNLPAPTVKIRTVGAGSGAFNPNADAAFEASLDTQMSLGTAPGAKETLYDIASLSNDDVTAAYTAIVEDNVVDVASSSFGQCELDFTAAYNGGEDFTQILKVEHAIFQQGNAQGITFVASSGDSGGLECLSVGFVNNPTNGTSFIAGVSSPADDPNVTAVGGTNLQTVGVPTADDATYSSENADFDPAMPAEFDIPNASGTGTTPVFVNDNIFGSGGGISRIFAKPFYQILVTTGSNTQRTVPDVSLMMGGCPGDADLAVQDCTKLPRSADIVWVGGEPVGLIGTSASAPEIAGVLALAIGVNGRLGNANALIYSLSLAQTLAGGVNAPKALQIFHRNISGNNGVFTVKPGQAYSEVLGNSTLDVKNFLGLPFVAPAGTPNTPSNP